MANTMPGAPMSVEGVHALDQLRQRLTQLSTSIGSLRADLEHPDMLPTWSSLYSSAQILSHNLSQLMVTFDTHRNILQASHAYPLTSFPGQTKEALLNELLRKRLEPQTEEWLKKHEVISETQTPALDLPALQQLWEFAGPRSNAVVQEMLDDGLLDDDFTIQEREHGIDTVVTGLQRTLAHAEDNADDGKEVPPMQDNSQAKDVATTRLVQSMPLEDVLKTISTGKILT